MKTAIFTLILTIAIVCTAGSKAARADDENALIQIGQRYSNLKSDGKGPTVEYVVSVDYAGIPTSDGKSGFYLARLHAELGTEGRSATDPSEYNYRVEFVPMPYSYFEESAHADINFLKLLAKKDAILDGQRYATLQVFEVEGGAKSKGDGIGFILNGAIGLLGYTRVGFDSHETMRGIRLVNYGLEVGPQFVAGDWNLALTGGFEGSIDFVSSTHDSIRHGHQFNEKRAYVQFKAKHKRLSFNAAVAKISTGLVDLKSEEPGAHDDIELDAIEITVGLGYDF